MVRPGIKGPTAKAVGTAVRLAEKHLQDPVKRREAIQWLKNNHRTAENIWQFTVRLAPESVSEKPGT